MFDLIGFWFVVSMVCVAMLTPLCFIAFPLVTHMVGKITGERDLVRKAEKYMFDYLGSGVHLVLNRLKVREELIWSSLIIGCSLWVCSLVSVYSPNGRSESVVELIAWWGANTAPFMGYVGVLALVYFGIIFFGKQFWKLKVKVDAVIEKASD